MSRPDPWYTSHCSEHRRFCHQDFTCISCCFDGLWFMNPWDLDRKHLLCEQLSTYRRFLLFLFRSNCALNEKRHCSAGPEIRQVECWWWSGEIRQRLINGVIIICCSDICIPPSPPSTSTAEVSPTFDINRTPILTRRCLAFSKQLASSQQAVSKQLASS